MKIPAKLFTAASIVFSFIAMHENAYANDYKKCPDNTTKVHIKAISYEGSNYYPTFSIEEDNRNTWLTLSKKSGLNTEYGRAMYALLLAAKSGYYPVTLFCDNSNGDVKKIDMDPK
ncbi:hypothetical protein D8666_07180 [Ochrobactrum soli]|uniref:hypothetical protein n=1 Tax=Brucella/Ochrobactrum group TaxID=2826938 RepID=UPI000D692036|nr:MULTISPECIES: hypothetical protein [Brucella]MDX4073917.1 hypothetical protein [Brucella sp. NBRC 113783]RLL75081.1 hypothetical protein D8666_07180 [[Ochrobactrum] soli]WHS32147.1 hypothetical protein QLQ09_09345 [Brucella sp. NM4]